jgi:molybdopterin synthase catalytic subunit
MHRLVREPIDVKEIQEQLIAPEDGAAAIFLGTVRNHARGKVVLSLEYSAYEPMALKKLEEIGTVARERYAIRDIAIVHRLGKLRPLDCSVAIVVTSAHRGPAFDACRFAIDEIKKVVPIWKKEVYADGECWIEGSNCTEQQN